MYAAERQRLILASVRDDRRVEVTALADRLAVAGETIRRDLSALERRGLVKRVHGGAIAADPTAPESGFDERLGRRVSEKQRIARRALQELPERSTVLLDAGTSTLALAQLLPAEAELTIVVNSPVVCATLSAKPGVEVLQLGGLVRQATRAAVGPWAIAALADLAVDVAFMGANGFDVERGLTTPDQAEAETKRAMVRAARTTILLADSSKAGDVHLHRFARLEEIDLLITDGELDEDVADAMSEAGPKVVLA